MSSSMSAHVSSKLSNCKKVRRAGDLKSREGSNTAKGGRREIKVREAGEQGREAGGSDPLAPLPPHKLHTCGTWAIKMLFRALLCAYPTPTQVACSSQPAISQAALKTCL